MGDKQDGHAPPVQAAHVVHKRAQVAPVLPHGWFVQDEKVGPQSQHRGQGSALLLPAAEGVDAAVTQTPQIGNGQGIFQESRSEEAVVARAKGHFLLHRLAKKLLQGILEKQAHLSSHLHFPPLGLYQASQ